MSSLAQVFSDIASSVRSKTGESTLYKPDQLSSAINNIGSGGSEDLENIKYLNRNDGWDEPQYVVGVNINDNKEFSFTGVEGTYNNAFMSGYNNSNPQTALGYRFIANHIYSQPSCYRLFRGNGINTSSEYETVYFGPGATNMEYTFDTCTNFNQPVIVNAPLNGMNYCFNNCTIFNQPFTVPDTVNWASCMFRNCTNLNQPITFPSETNTQFQMSSIFYGCTNFNQPVVFPNNTPYLEYTFTLCESFNQPFTVPSMTNYMGRTFYDCHSFNQPITIPENVDYMQYTFYNCYNFNQSVTFLTNKLTTMNYCFTNCYNFNQPIEIPESVVYMSNTFENCSNLSQVLIKGLVYYVRYAFSGCTNIKDIYFKNSRNMSGSSSTRYMLNNKNTDMVTNIWCNYEYPFTTTGSYSIVGQDVTWDAMADGNGYYNTAFNIYIYNNYS